MIELQVNSLSITYPNGVKALNEVSFTLGQGMFGLLGPNGAGKSSLMRTLATLQKPDQGSITFNGIDTLSDPKRFRQQLGYLPQNFGVYEGVSAESLLDYFARMKGLTNKTERKRHTNSLLETVNLFSDRHKNVDTFSGGMRQRFGIAQALIGNPKLIIVDEPTAGLDPAERNRFYSVLNNIGENAIVILSTHIVRDINTLCNDMAILSNGTLLVRGTPDTLVKSVEDLIWQVDIEQSDLEKYREKYKLISTRFHRGKLRVIVQSELALGNPFIAKHADLEDLYFSYIPEVTI